MNNENKNEENGKLKVVKIPTDYDPIKDDDFMNPIMTAYFKQKLIEWRGELLTNLDSTIENLQHSSGQEADPNDVASIELQKSLDLQVCSRDQQVIQQIDVALSKIEDGSYGFCEISDEPISVKRLLARPTATMTVVAQEKYEAKQKSLRI